MAFGPGVALTIVGLALAIGIHTAVAVVGIRFLRVRLATRWGPIVYALFLVPLIFVPTTVIIAGVIGTGGVTLDPGTLVAVLFVLPLGLGFAIDYFWLPSPAAIEPPAESGGA